MRLDDAVGGEHVLVPVGGLNEEDAFWCLVILVDQVVPGYFSEGMAAAKLDQRVFARLLHIHLPSVGGARILHHFTHTASYGHIVFKHLWFTRGLTVISPSHTSV